MRSGKPPWKSGTDNSIFNVFNVFTYSIASRIYWAPILLRRATASCCTSEARALVTALFLFYCDARTPILFILFGARIVSYWTPILFILFGARTVSYFIPTAAANRVDQIESRSYDWGRSADDADCVALRNLIFDENHAVQQPGFFLVLSACHSTQPLLSSSHPPAHQHLVVRVVCSTVLTKWEVLL